MYVSIGKVSTNTSVPPYCNWGLTVDFTSHGTSVAIAAGNLWLVLLATFTLHIQTIP